MKPDFLHTIQPKQHITIDCKAADIKIYLSSIKVFLFFLDPIILLNIIRFIMLKNIKRSWDFPGGAVVKNPPANAGDTGSSPGPGRSHKPCP